MTNPSRSSELDTRSAIPHLGESDCRNLFESTDDAVFIFDPDTEEILAANQRAADHYGLPLDQLVGRSVREFTADTDRGAELIERPSIVGCSIASRRSIVASTGQS